MKKYTRREFVKTGIAGASVVSAGMVFSGTTFGSNSQIDQVELGKTGLKVSRLALGCGTNSWGRKSEFTRAGLETFKNVARYAHERGVTFFDTADLYGTHTYVKEVLKEIPRDQCQVMTKIWTTDNDWNTVAPVSETLDRFKKELGTDYFDIVLLHCMLDGKWVTEKKEFRDQLSEQKQKGIVKTVGVSCHNIDALRVAATDPWVDIILARINPQQIHMDGSPNEIMEILATATRKGKGVLGMKIFGAGEIKDEELREKSLNYVLKCNKVHAITIGMEKKEYIEDSVERITRITKNL
ncbi:aldo/keto reductase [Sunxiuqinia sp. A32]|uniref:aldo/keto reductase n=1 Tax=Sunxiuqinia sp. A32 TaxID=3461496 RepID=UPI004045823E